MMINSATSNQQPATMNLTTIQSNIEAAFRKKVQDDRKVKNAYLLVHSEKHDIHLDIAEGATGDVKADSSQPNHLASVGKLFTATVTGMLHERRMLDFDDPIHKHLDADLMKGLHVFKAQDHSEKITIRHLLMQTSGLNDVFYHLMKKMIQEPDFRITPKEAVKWGRENLKPVAVPGKRHFYTDTNYYLLGLIIENITGKAFHEVMHEFVFDRIGMHHAYMYGFSTPKKASKTPTAPLYVNGRSLFSINGIHQVDYAGGSVTAPLGEYLLFMKALQNGHLIKKETLNRMISDDINMGFPTLGFRYGYAIWKMKTLPVIMPAKYACWGCVGATGAFMFYHPITESYVIGTFNDFSYRGKALGFMARKVIREILKLENNKT